MKKEILNSILSCSLKCLRFHTIVFKKKIIWLFFFGFLANCTSPSAMLTPVYTFSSTGNVYQAGLSYGSNKFIEKITGKTMVENLRDIKLSEEDENIQKKTLESEDFYFLVKNKVEKINIEVDKFNQ